VCEIGASRGASTDSLLALPDVSITVIDPCLDLDLEAKYAGEPRATICKANSLFALPTLGQAYDCILIDGDHNWYTVYNELRTISERLLLQRGGIIFLHDVGWPYGRRDMYYQPHTIPSEYRHGYARRGIVWGQNKLSDDAGINVGLCNATHEGGRRNGVLTGIEDFLREHENEYQFFRVREQFGLGVLHYRKNLADDLGFLTFEGLTWAESSAREWFTRARSSARQRFPSVCLLAKSALSSVAGAKKRRG